MPNVSHRHFEYLGNKIHYVKSGLGNPIILLPGGASDWRIFKPWIKRLAKDHTVFIVDLPGRGETEYKHDSCGLEECANIIKEFINSHSLINPIFIGYSYGGCVFYEMLKKFSEMKPKKVIFISTGNFFSPTKSLFYKLLFIPPTMSKQIMRLYAKIISRSDIRLAVLENTDLLQKEILLKSWLEILDWSPTTNKDLDSEVLIINGSKDRIVQKPIESDNFPSASVKVVTEVSGHNELINVLAKNELRNLNLP